MHPTVQAKAIDSQNKVLQESKCAGVQESTCRFLPRSEEASCPKDGVAGEAQEAPSLASPAWFVDPYTQ